MENRRIYALLPSVCEYLHPLDVQTCIEAFSLTKDEVQPIYFEMLKRFDLDDEIEDSIIDYQEYYFSNIYPNYCQICCEELESTFSSERLEAPLCFSCQNKFAFYSSFVDSVLQRQLPLLKDYTDSSQLRAYFSPEIITKHHGGKCVLRTRFRQVENELAAITQKVTNGILKRAFQYIKTHTSHFFSQHYLEVLWMKNSLQQLQESNTSLIITSFFHQQKLFLDELGRAGETDLRLFEELVETIKNSYIKLFSITKCSTLNSITSLILANKEWQLKCDMEKNFITLLACSLFDIPPGDISPSSTFFSLSKVVWKDKKIWHESDRIRSVQQAFNMLFECESPEKRKKRRIMNENNE